jgi:hypothetical protein
MKRRTISGIDTSEELHMFPVYLKIFDEKLLFPQGTTEGAQLIPLYTVFTGQAALFFCLIEGDERRRSWYRISLASGRNEDEPFAQVGVACQGDVVKAGIAPGAGTLQQIDDVGRLFASMYQEGDYAGILGIDRNCKDPGIFEKACETQKLVFSEEKEIQAICDNAEHRLTSKHRPPPPPPPVPMKKQPEPDISAGSDTGRFVSILARSVAYGAAAVALLIGALCLLIVTYLYYTGGRPVIEIIR